MPRPEIDKDFYTRGVDAAVVARRRRAEVKTAVREGGMTVASAMTLADADDAVGRMRVLDLCKSLPGFGPLKTSSLLEACGISEKKRLAGLTQRQKDMLLSQLESRGIY